MDHKVRQPVFGCGIFLAVVVISFLLSFWIWTQTNSNHISRSWISMFSLHYVPTCFNTASQQKTHSQTVALTHIRDTKKVTQISGIWGEYTLWLCQNSYWKWPFIVDLPIKNGDFPQQTVSLPEGTWIKYHHLWAVFKTQRRPFLLPG